MKEKNKYHEIFVVSLSTLGLLAIGFASFPWQTRKKILERDGNKSVLSGKTERLHAAHITHDKNDERYYKESNGRTLTIQEHYEDHYYRHGHNGLPKNQNIGALRLLWQSMSEYEREGLPDYHDLLD